MTKSIPYILIAILVIGIVSLYMLWLNKNETKEQTGMLKDQGKVQGDQSTMLIALAKKLIGDTAVPEVAEGKPATEVKTVDPKKALTQEEEDQVIMISDKLCFDKPLTQTEIEFKSKYAAQINKEYEKSKKILSSLISKFMSDTKDFTLTEKDFYQDNQEDIDTMVQDKKLLASVVAKLTSGKTDFSDEELQFQTNFPLLVEAELSRIKADADKFKGSNPPNSADERLKLIRSFFEDGIPKTVTALSELYAEATKTKPSKGNTSNIFGKLVEEEKILCEKAGRGKPVYHGLPEWFEKGKLKPEYHEKITKS